MPRKTAKNSAASRATRLRRGSAKRREKQRDDVRQLILSAASDEFLGHGYEDFSLRRVAETIGYSPTAIYLHFKNKDELLLCTVQEGFNRFDQTLEDAAKGRRKPLRRILALGEAYIEFGIANPALYRLMFMQRSDLYFMPRLTGEDSSEDVKGDEADEYEVYQVKSQTLLVAAVQDGIEDGTVRRRDPLITADALWAGAHGIVSLANSPLMDAEHAQKVSGQLLQTLIDGISTA